MADSIKMTCPACKCEYEFDVKNTDIGARVECKCGCTWTWIIETDNFFDPEESGE